MLKEKGFWRENEELVQQKESKRVAEQKDIHNYATKRALSGKTTEIYKPVHYRNVTNTLYTKCTELGKLGRKGNE